ncbi:hypothetical protein BGZ95_003147, partial [Linnemannia exigua]
IPLLPNEDPTVLARFQREVNLLCNNKIFCNAKSQVLIKDQQVYDLVVKDGVGIDEEDVCWDVEMEDDDNIAWVNPDLEVK